MIATVRGRASARGWTMALVVLFALPAGADTVHLKPGGKIKNCRVIEDGPEFLVIRTPNGRMDVPKEVVRRVERRESILDVYDGKRAAVRDDDSARLYVLAEWCRKNAGLREEMRELLEKVIALDEDHGGARRNLGFVREGGKWVKLPPLSLALRAKGAEEIPESVRKYFSLVAATRSDVEIVSALKASGDLDGCELITGVKTGRTGAATFYGVEISGPAVHAVVELSASGALVAGKRFELTIRGEVKASLPDAKNEAISDGFSRAGNELHALLDQILEHRMAQAEAARVAKREGTRRPGTPEKCSSRAATGERSQPAQAGRGSWNGL